MRRQSTQLHLSFPPDPAALLPVRRRLRAFLTLHVADVAAIDDIVLCVQEAMKNSVRFSLSEAAIEVDVRLVPGAVEVRVRDFGEGFKMPDVHSLRPADPLALSGRGLFLIAALSDELEVVTRGGVELRILKRIDLGFEQAATGT